MSATRFSSVLVFFGCILVGCGEKQEAASVTQFTKLDSLTDTYLALQDSMLQSWNTMIKDDNEKLNAMYNILHELEVSGSASPLTLKSLKERINQLRESRYTQKTMGNQDIIEEYDFASNALVSELLVLAESQKEFAYNSTLQKLADKIRTADQRVETYREEYDRITVVFNEFIEENKIDLKEIESDSFIEKKPLFQMASDK